MNSMSQPSFLRSALLASATCSTGEWRATGSTLEPTLGIGLSTCRSDISNALETHSARGQLQGANKSMMPAYSARTGSCLMLHAADG